LSRISVHGATEAQFIREALECAALRRAVGRLSAADIKQLEKNLERQQDAHAAHDVDRAQRANVHLNRARRLSLPEVSTVGALIDQHARGGGRGLPAPRRRRGRGHVRRGRRAARRHLDPRRSGGTGWITEPPAS
jgi:hypothetical protein